MAIAFVKQTIKNQTTNFTSDTSTVSSTTGNCLILLMNISGTAFLNSVTDSAGNTWVIPASASTTNPPQKQNGTGVNFAMAYCLNATAVTSVTVGISSSNKASYNVVEFSGVATASAVDQSNGATIASGTTLVGPSITTTNANDLLIGGIAVATATGAATLAQGSSSPTSGWTALTAGTAGGNLSGAYQIVSATGTDNLAWTVGSAGVAASGIMSFKEAAVTPPTNTVAPAVTPTIVTKGGAEAGTDGTWTGSPSFTYQWFRADDAAFSVNVTSIGSATAASYTPVTADVSKYLRLTVTGTNGGGSASAVSNVVGKVSIIAFDASAGSGYKAASSSYTFNHSLGAIGSGLLLVQVGILTVAGSVSSLTASLTISGSTVVTAMDFVTATTFGAYRVELWALATGTTALAPQTSTITVNLNAIIASIASSVSYANVDQTEPTAEIASATGTGNPGSVTVVPIQDQDWIVDAFSSSDTAVTVGSGQVSRQNQTGALGSLAASDKGPVTPAASTNMQWTAVGATDTWAYVAAAVQPLGAGNDWTIPRLDGTIDLCANDTIVTYTLAGAGLPHERLLTGVGT